MGDDRDFFYFIRSETSRDTFSERHREKKEQPTEKEGKGKREERDLD